MGIPLCCNENKDIPDISDDKKIIKNLPPTSISNISNMIYKIIKIQSRIRVFLAQNKLNNLFDSIKFKIIRELEQKKLINEINIIECESHKYYTKYISSKKIFPFSQELKQNEELNKLILKLSKYSFVIPYYIVTSPNEVYKGSWNVYKKYNGYGVKYEFNEEKTTNKRVEGIFLNGFLFGEGRIIFSNGDLIIGNFIRNSLNGTGEHYRRDNSIYKGEFKNGKYNGVGKEIFQDQSYFVGSFYDGHKKYGKFIFKNGSKYQGEFLNEAFHGNGIYSWPNKKLYEGNWKEGKMSGKGKFLNPDGSYYEGDFVDGKKCGFGKYVWGKDKYYEGEWENNKQNGKGIYFDKNKVLKGIWHDGKFMNKSLRKIRNTFSFLNQCISRNETPIKKGATQEYFYKKNNLTEKKNRQINFNPTAKGNISKIYYKNYINLKKNNQNSMYSFGSANIKSNNNNNYEDSKISNID